VVKTQTKISFELNTVLIYASQLFAS